MEGQTGDDVALDGGVITELPLSLSLGMASPRIILISDKGQLTSLLMAKME